MENEWVLFSIGLGIFSIALVVVTIFQRKEIGFYKLQEDELDQYATEVETVYR